MSDERKPKQTSSRGRLGRLARLWSAGRAAVNPFHGHGPDRDDARQQAWRRTIRRRTFVTLGCIVLWIAGVEARLVQLQVVRYEKYSAAARKQQQSQLNIEALRGDIVDRNGRLLAYSVKAQAIFADPRYIEDPDKTVAAICRALADCTSNERAALTTKLKAPGERHVYIRRSRQVAPEQVERVAKLELQGIGFERDTRRYYPNGSLAAHVLGWVGQDHGGQAGIEQVFEREIRGQSGIGHAQVDNKRRTVETRIDREPVPGANIELTIDAQIQHIVEQALKDHVAKTRAQGAVAVVMDPRTGEVLGMASYPTFNPNMLNRSTPDVRRNRATEHVYEPGSTFKIVTASAALETGVISAHETIDTNPGYIRLPGRYIDEASGRNYGVLTFEDSLVKSSNVAAIRIGLRTGADAMIRYVNRFGFGKVASRDFGPEQSAGIWAPDNLNESGLASVSMGYQISATPLQMVAAVSAVANGGLLVEPRVVRAVVRNGVREAVQPNFVRRVMEERTARTLTGMMKSVVSRGTATSAVIAGYPAAGKTGTSTRLAEGGGYSRENYNASFAGFVPADNPAVSILVVVDSPRTSIYGGVVAAPVFRQIAEGVLLHMGISPEGEGHTPMTVRAGGSETARVQRVSVSEQQPSIVRAGGPVVTPDVRGLSARDANRVLAAVGMSARMSGSGFVVTQMPAAGTPIEPGAATVLVLRRDPALREGDVP